MDTPQPQVASEYPFTPARCAGRLGDCGRGMSRGHVTALYRDSRSILFYVYCTQVPGLVHMGPGPRKSCSSLPEPFPLPLQVRTTWPLTGQEM